jgi:hypothetical protein
LFSAEGSLWKRLWTCRKTNFVVVMVVVMTMTTAAAVSPH